MAQRQQMMAAAEPEQYVKKGVFLYLMKRLVRQVLPLLLTVMAAAATELFVNVREAVPIQKLILKN